MQELSVRDFLWALGSCSAMHGKPFDTAQALAQNPPPYTTHSLVAATRKLGFQVREETVRVEDLSSTAISSFLVVTDKEFKPTVGILVKCEGKTITWIQAGTDTANTEALEVFSKHFAGQVLLIKPSLTKANDEESSKTENFGFSWFVPELLKYKSVWRDVLIASLALQLLALGLPLFTQAIIDKVVVHRTQSTLIAVGIGMAIFMVATSVLSWVRQYLVLHTGNRVDAVLAMNVFEHLFKLPPRYFQSRPTGVIAARLHGVETIREFVSSAAVTLVLDIPFLLVAVAIMFYYSVTLTSIALGILGLICIISMAVAPIFQRRMNDQFALGARNQAFLTEYIAGVETVKSLQFEPQLKAKYSDFLASYLQSGFLTKQIGNTYNVFSTSLEQLMTLSILLVGAWLVMNPEAGKTNLDEAKVFTIGMLVAFQMFAGRLSQPVMRLVGLWQQFQQARLAVIRLGDLMNVPPELYSAIPQRKQGGEAFVTIDRIGFRYADDMPFLYENLSLTIEPGSTVAIMGPSGSGKSTFAKLLQGFYRPTSGQIRIDNIDTRHMSANDLRATFGVVPQETVLFSGTIYENLSMANPHATFEQITQACRMAEINTTIDSLPQGYQTVIGERGAGLSGGQRQRLAIARALLKRPKVLIFDEATSALDEQTANQFALTINKLKGKVTMIFITHALPKCLIVDKTIMIRNN